MLKKFILIQVILSFLLFFITAAGQAQIRTISVSVDGLSCSFCAYGLEKKLKKMEGVEAIKIGLQEGMVTLSVKKGRSINISRIRVAIKDAGFTPRKMKITATGIIKTNEQQQFLLQLSGLKQEFLIVDLKKAAMERLFSFAKSGATLEIEGVIHEKPDGLWTLSPESVKEVSE